jgi:UDP-3-O-[3-hydroxymyristoyl] N-acetylglucosamine deacetylase
MADPNGRALRGALADQRVIRRQRTLRAPFERDGIGIHTGARCRVRVRPADADSGIVIEAAGETFPAHSEFVTDANRCTALGAAGVRVGTVEHLLAALAGLGVDNAVVSVEGPEAPILDGSALPWVEAIRAAGMVDQASVARSWAPKAAEVLSDGPSWYVAVPSAELLVTCVASFDHPLLGTRAVSHDASPDGFVRDVAPARTFGFADEVERLREAGLALGGRLDNALVIYPDRFSSPLRMPDEWARHKLLDLIGDLALAGVRIEASITAIRPSHRGNVAFAALLRSRALAEDPRRAKRGRTRAGVTGQAPGSAHKENCHA